MNNGYVINPVILVDQTFLEKISNQIVSAFLMTFYFDVVPKSEHIYFILKLIDSKDYKRAL